MSRGYDLYTEEFEQRRSIQKELEELKSKHAKLRTDLKAADEKLLAISQAGGFPPWMGQEIANKDKWIVQLQAENKRLRTLCLREGLVLREAVKRKNNKSMIAVVADSLIKENSDE